MTQIGNAQSSSDDEVDGEQITYVTGNTGLGQSNCDGKGLTTPQDEMGSGFQLTLVPGYDDDPKRKPKEFAPRQVQMMGLGSAIGTGLLLHSGTGLYFSGPVSLWIAYLLIGTVPYAVLITLGEMVSFLPVPGGFVTLANRCLSRSIGFICGWAYCFSNIMAYAIQLSTAPVVISFWLPDVNYAVWISLFFVTSVLFNLLNVRRFGEVEYWLTVVKIATIVGLIILGVLLPMGASVGTRLLKADSLAPCPPNPAPEECLEPPGFPYWGEGAFLSYIYPGDFGRLVGLWYACVLATFAYTGVEMIGIAAHEAERQRDTIPRAVRRVSQRIVLYYVGAVFVLGLNVSVRDQLLQQSAFAGNARGGFVLMVHRAGLKILPSVVNAGALVAVLSIANSDLYLTSRTLYALGRERQAPKIFQKKLWLNVPVPSVCFSALFGLLAFMSVPNSVGPNNVFSFLGDLTVACCVLPWAVICATYLRFRQAVKVQRLIQLIPVEARSPLQPYLAIYGFVMSTLIMIFSGYTVFTRHNAIWAKLNDDWGFSIGPWATLGVFCLAFLALLAQQGWSLQIPPLLKVDLHDGMAVLVADEKKQNGWFEKMVRWILEKL